MEDSPSRAIAIVGLGAILPDAPNVATFWENIKSGHYSITDVSRDRWDPSFYYDPDPAAPDKTYSKIGGWVRECAWDPAKWRLAIPPRVADAMDPAQKWTIAATREALEDYGYPKRPLDTDRVAVILGNAMAGEKHYQTSMRVNFPEYAHELEESSAFAALPEATRTAITREMLERIGKRLPPVTEDTMPGELANCIAGRIANIYNFHGPNFVCDAACASAMAAMTAAVEGLIAHDFDAAITGGIDRNMGAATFVKFCKIGALSATGTRPYAEGADGFVMGEGSAIFVMKRLPDAEREGDKIYAVLRGIGASSDGRGKGITAPNPVGQKFCLERAWQNAGISPDAATLFEGHGTSTRVGDVVEAQTLADMLRKQNLAEHSVPLGSVKSNIGHLKGAAGAAGLLKATLALHEKVLPPSVHCEHPSPDIDFAHSPLYVNTELRPWTAPPENPRRAGVSAFGFGGTNFHLVLEEHIPHRLTGNGKRSIAVSAPTSPRSSEVFMNAKSSAAQLSSVAFGSKAPLRGSLLLGASSQAELSERLRRVLNDAKSGRAPALAAPSPSDLRAPFRLAIDHSDAADLADKADKALKAIAANQPPLWKALRAQGIFRGQGPAGKVAFLYTGQGSQYVNMLRHLRESQPIVADTFAEADRVMKPLLGKPLSEFVFVDSSDARAVANAEEALRHTAITQPAVITTDIALTRMIAAHGIEPDFTMGHSLGEYGALVASGALPFSEALEAVSARGREMTSVSWADNGRMAAVFAPLDEIKRILKMIDGYLVVANINSEHQAVVGGASTAVEKAIAVFQKAGYEITPIPVSHAFHTSIVAPASEPLRRTLERLHLQSPRVPIVANVNGEFYPQGPDVVPEMVDILAKQVASPVQFIKGLKTLYAAGARVFIEVGPKKALHGFAEDVLGANEDVLPLFTNHPKFGDVVSFNQALCGLYAAGLGSGEVSQVEITTEVAVFPEPVPAVAPPPPKSEVPSTAPPHNGNNYAELGKFFADVLERGWQLYQRRGPSPRPGPVVITGAALGLPGTEHVFDDGNIARILRGDQFIDLIPTRLRKAMLEKHITRLVKSDEAGPTFETINDVAEVIKLAGRGGAFDLQKEFGIPADRDAAFDRVTQLAIAAGIDALRDAGIPLVMRYKKTSKGTRLPDRWGLPDSLRDGTGVIFASAFPGCNSFADEMARYYKDHSLHEQLNLLQSILSRSSKFNGDSSLERELERHIEELRDALEKEPYIFNRRFLLRTLAMGHSQFAELIGARGPNTQINSACASTTQAVSLAQDWIHAGRCRRVIIISADDVTSDHSLEWFGAGFLASGAAATDESVEAAATPFDRRRHGLIVGMGAASIVVESEEAARERGIQPICEILSTVTANSAFHGTRLDVNHIAGVMDELIREAETLHGMNRNQIAPRAVFVSHETYTPARGGSASAEVNALRHVFGASADQIVIANTKGFTGHAMGAGVEDVVAVKTLETGLVPPIANFKEVDPELGTLNLSKGGSYPVEYAIRLGAGFGSQISMTLLHWKPTKDGIRRRPNALGYAYRIADENVWTSWLKEITGSPKADLEIVNRTLRVRDQGLVSRPIEETTRAQTQVEVAKPESTVPSHAPVIVQEEKPVVHPVVASRTGEREEDPAKQKVLALVAEKTGYPVDMLELDLDLEADLGIDTVKQAEVFATIREAYGIPRNDKIKLRDFPTLAHVIRFVNERGRNSDAPKPPSQPHAQSNEAPVVIPQALTQAAASPEPVCSTASDSVKQRILGLVVEKTGYPEDMLDLDLDLEVDLGIDTVKQAEMLAAIREIYQIPRDENRKLRDYPTLGHVIRFVYEKRPDLACPAAAASESSVTGAQVSPEPPVRLSAPPVVPGSVDDPVKKKVLALVVEKTGYPEDMLDLDLDLEADLGVDTVKQAEMFAAIRESYQIPRDEIRKLRDYPTLAHVIRFVYEMRPDLATSSVAAPTSPATAEIVAESTIQCAPQVVETGSEDPIKNKVLAIVAEKTGYPEDMLDLDLDLEADLGIDTVKQAEMFAAVRAAYDIPRDENLKLRDFPTLAHVIKFAHERSRKGIVAPTAQGQGATIPKAQDPQTVPEAGKPPLASLDAANRIPRRVPLPLLRPPVTFFKDTIVRLARGTRVLIMPDKGGVADAVSKKLCALDVEVTRLDPLSTADALTSAVETYIKAGPVHGVYWLPALDPEGEIRDLKPAIWHEALRVRVKSLYTVMRTLYSQIAQTGTFLISATRMGGYHGYDEAGAVSPAGGAVVGFSKAYKREHMEVLVKALDFETRRDSDEIAEVLIEETLHDPGAIEIGYTGHQRWVVGLQEKPADDGQPSMQLDKNTVFVVTGAAGSIVSAITSDLAAASGGTFYLVDMVPKPDPTNADLKRLITDREGLKRDLFSRIQQRGGRATPALIEKELAGLERAQAAQAAIDAVTAAGGTAQYFSVNLIDPVAVAGVVDEIRKRSGRIDVVLHAAGMDRSHALPDKDPKEFDLVFDVKADGFFNLLHAIGDMPLGAAVVFSSIAGRFGNVGQTDYSAANDLLCKITSNFRMTRPSVRAIAIDWTAWSGIGMAARGSIPKIMEAAGIDMLPPEAGVPVIRRELTAGGTRGEVVIAQRLGVLLNEFDATGGLDSAAVSKLGPEAGPIAADLASATLYDGFTVSTVLDPSVQPFLYDHKIDGTPVLPGVMGVEAFAEAAVALLPGWRVRAVEDIVFLAPFKFYRNEPRSVKVEVRIHPDKDDLVAECRLIGSRSLPNQSEPQATTHFTARVRVTRSVVDGVRVEPVRVSGSTVEPRAIYQVFFHGPAYQVLEKASWNGQDLVGQFAGNLPANHHPAELSTTAAPRLIELCFQTAGLWELGTVGRMGLPRRVREIRMICDPNAVEEALYAVITPCAGSESFDVKVQDAKGNCYLTLAGYETVELPGAVSPDNLKPLQACFSGETVLAA